MMIQSQLEQTQLPATDNEETLDELLEKYDFTMTSTIYSKPISYVEASLLSDLSSQSRSLFMLNIFYKLIETAVFSLTCTKEELSLLLDTFRIDRTEDIDDFEQPVILTTERKAGLYKLSTQPGLNNTITVSLELCTSIIADVDNELSGNGFELGLNGWIPVIRLDMSSDYGLYQEYVYYDDLRIICRIQFSTLNKLDGVTKHSDVAAGLNESLLGELSKDNKTPICGSRIIAMAKSSAKMEYLLTILIN